MPGGIGAGFVAVHHVVAGPAQQGIAAFLTEEDVVAGAAVHGVVAHAAEGPVVAGAGINGVVAFRGELCLRAVEGIAVVLALGLAAAADLDPAGERPAGLHLQGDVVAEQQIVATPAHEKIASAAPRKDVRGGAADELIVARAAVGPVALAGLRRRALAGDDGLGQRAFDVGIHGVVAGAAVNAVGFGPAHHAVVAASGANEVFAAAPVDLVHALGAEQGVGASVGDGVDVADHVVVLVVVEAVAEVGVGAAPVGEGGVVAGNGVFGGLGGAVDELQAEVAVGEALSQVELAAAGQVQGPGTVVGQRDCAAVGHHGRPGVARALPGEAPAGKQRAAVRAVDDDAVARAVVDDAVAAVAGVPDVGVSARTADQYVGATAAGETVGAALADEEIVLRAAGEAVGARTAKHEGALGGGGAGHAAAAGLEVPVEKIGKLLENLAALGLGKARQVVGKVQRIALGGIQRRGDVAALEAEAAGDGGEEGLVAVGGSRGVLVVHLHGEGDQGLRQVAVRQGQAAFLGNSLQVRGEAVEHLVGEN